MIEYKFTKNFSEAELKELFQSVNWLSANYSERLVNALANSGTVVSAWDGKKLVGLVNALDDGELTAYVHYLLVNPKYQHKGIGAALLQAIKEKYANYLYIILGAETQDVIAFYEKQGFVKSGAGLMEICKG